MSAKEDVLGNPIKVKDYVFYRDSIYFVIKLNKKTIRVVGVDLLPVWFKGTRLKTQQIYPEHAHLLHSSLDYGADVPMGVLAYENILMSHNDKHFQMEDSHTRALVDAAPFIKRNLY